MNKIFAYVLVVCVVLQISCRNNTLEGIDEAKNPIVTVYGQTLYKAELDSALQGNVSAADSLAIADLYVHKWIDNVLLYEKARRNISDKKKINQLVEEYRKNLITGFYQEHLLKTKLEQEISEDKIKEYYAQHENSLKLKEPIIKGMYLKIPLVSSQLENFEKWYKQGTEQAVENIEKYTLQNAIGYEYFYNRWVLFSEIMNMIPRNISDPDEFLKSNKTFEVKDSSFVYLLNIKSYLPKGSIAPYEFVKNDLVRDIQEKERMIYINQIREDLYAKAMSEDNIKFYSK